MRERKEAEEASTPDGAASQLAARLCAFLRARGGRCNSQALVGHFKSECTNPALFKEVLRQVASKDASGVWQLNEGFDA